MKKQHFCLIVLLVVFSTSRMVLGAVLYDVQSASVTSNTLEIVIFQTENVYKRSLGDMIFSSRGRLIDRKQTLYGLRLSEPVPSLGSATFLNPSQIMEVSGNEPVACYATRQPGVYSYFFGRQSEVGWLDSSKNMRGILNPPQDSRQADWIGRDGMLYWLTNTQVLFYDVVMRDFSLIGVMPHRQAKQEIQKINDPSVAEVYVVGGSVVVWERYSVNIRVYALVSGEMTKEITLPHSKEVCGVSLVEGPLHIALSNDSEVSVIGEDGETKAQTLKPKGVFTRNHCTVLLPEKSLFIAITRDIHPERKSVVIWVWDWGQNKECTYSIKLPGMK